MTIPSKVEEARQAYEASIQRMDDQRQKIADLPDDTPEDERKLHDALFQKTEDESERLRKNLEGHIAVHRAYEAMPRIPEEPSEEEKEKGMPAGTLRVNEPLVYERKSPHSFFGDLVRMKEDPAAAKRLHDHQTQVRVHSAYAEYRDVTSADPGGLSFIPPIYLGSQWIEKPRAGRPFANQVPKMPLPGDGLTLSLPRVQTGTAVAIQASENSAVQETDFDSETVSVPVRTIAGQNDVSRQLLERSQPGIDEVIFSDLTADYDAKLDAQLLNGSGSSGQHTGIRVVSGSNAVTYTDSTPTSAELLPKVYDAIQQIATNRFREGDLIVMHPRRAAWLASNLSSTFPLFQLGSLVQASGTQEQGFTAGIAGLNVVRDANVLTNLGATTNADEIYVLRVEDTMLAEGPLQAKVFEDVLSGTLQVRLQVYAYSAFAIRLPAAISVISGSGLVAPTF